jgi:hypothetical protein
MMTPEQQAAIVARESAWIDADRFAPLDLSAFPALNELPQNRAVMTDASPVIGVTHHLAPVLASFADSWVIQIVRPSNRLQRKRRTRISSTIFAEADRAALQTGTT